MGGKHKQAQRTKNNARPSSSGRSAELLGANLPQFSAFSSSKEHNFSLVGMSVPEEIDSTIDSNFQLVLKKMNKKDATTKLKALQEFADLVKSSESDAVIAVLPFWPRLYNILATDTEHRVREAVHVAHLQVVLKVKRNIAPFLKQLVAPWFTSQYDTYPPAAYAAKNAFESAFPSNKLQEAIVFCQDEILSYISDNLTVHSPQTLGNPKTTSVEELEAKYERVIISSLQGYTLYLNKVNSEAVRKSQESNEQLILNSKFWKLSKHKLPPVRSAWFETITAVCMKVPFLLEKNHSQLTTTVFNNLNETEPTVLPRVWETVLLTVTTVPEWSTFINVDKMFLPKLWKILREGGQGSAVVIYRNLLPLISNIPSDIDINLFYSNYFENMRIGLKQRNVLASKSETSAIASAFIECLQFIIMKNQDDIILCEKLIKTQLIPLMEWTLIETQAASKLFFNQISVLVQYWNRNRNNLDLNNYNRYLEYFWSNVGSLMEGLMMNYEFKYEVQNVVDLALKQVELLLSLKQTPKPKKLMKVSFVINEANVSSKESDTNTTCGLDQHYMTSLNKLVYQVCELYVKLINEKQCKELIEHLYSLIYEFESENFFKYLKLKQSDSQLEFLDLYKTLFSKWLKSSYLSSQSVVDLIFLLLLNLSNEDKLYVLDELIELNNEKTFACCVGKALSHPYNNEVIIKNWLKNDNVSAFLINIIKMVFTSDCPSNLILILKQAFQENEEGDLFITKHAVDQIIELLSESMMAPEKYPDALDTTVSLASFISAIIYSERFYCTYDDKLFISLFSLTCSFAAETKNLSKDTLWEAVTAWQDAIDILSVEMQKEEFLTLCSKCADVVQGIALQKPLEEAVFLNVVDKLSVFLKSSKHIMQDVVSILFNREFIPKFQTKLINMSIYPEFILGKLSSPYKDLNYITSFLDEDNEFEYYFTWKYFLISVLAKPNTDDDEDEEDFITLFEELHNNTEIALDILYDLCLADLYVTNYSMVKNFNLISRLAEKMKTTFIQMKSLNEIELEELLLKKIFSDEWFWTKVSYLYNRDVVKGDLDNAFNNIISHSGSPNLGKLHLLQTYSSHLTYDNINYKLEPVEKIIALRSLLHCEEIDVQIGETFATIVQLKNEILKENFYDIDFSSWSKSQIVIEILQLFNNLVKSRGIDNISTQHRDLIFISIASWSSRMTEVKQNYSNIQVIGFLVAVINLFASIDEGIKLLEKDGSKNSCINEWRDVFAQSVQSDYIKTWFYFAGEFSKGEISKIQLRLSPISKIFNETLYRIDCTNIFTNVVDGMPKWSKLLKTCFPLLLNSDTHVQLWGYRMLMSMIPGLINVDSVSVNTNTPHEKGLILEQFRDTLTKTQDIVQVMLIDFKLGEDSCRVEPFTDSYTYTFAYFLMWDIVLTLCEKASTELSYQYSDWLKKEDLLNNLLNHIFKLMPMEVFNEIKSKQLLNYFVERPDFSVSESNTSETLEHLVCWIYSFTLLNLPASVRQWWTNAETKTAQIVERITSEYLSTYLCNQELSAVAQHETKFKNMVIKVLKSIRTVKATYTVDEAQMELLITLPTNYPLGGPDVQCNREIGGNSHKQWLMQLKMCVLHQNGRIWDGLSLWNHNLDKKFDGVEECYICFAVLHPGTYQLPKLSCHTCRKKFHSACLYKWFSTSNKSTCPICRNLF